MVVDELVALANEGTEQYIKSSYSFLVQVVLSLFEKIKM